LLNTDTDRVTLLIVNYFYRKGIDNNIN
jgi:hypothetical protein